MIDVMERMIYACGIHVRYSVVARAFLKLICAETYKPEPGY
jgi:hypothetical protein